jgi:hypothetical protein
MRSLATALVRNCVHPRAPEGPDLEFPFIKIDDSGNVTWESGDNRTYTTPVDSTGEYEGYWQN